MLMGRPQRVKGKGVGITIFSRRRLAKALNPKFQIPMKSQAPNPKLLSPPWDLDIGISLGFGFWDFPTGLPPHFPSLRTWL